MQMPRIHFLMVLTALQLLRESSLPVAILLSRLLSHPPGRRPQPHAQHSRTNPFVSLPASPSCGIPRLHCVGYHRFTKLEPPGSPSPTYTKRFISSVVVMFEDLDGLVAKSLLTTKKLYTFGNCVALKKWKQCSAHLFSTSTPATQASQSPSQWHPFLPAPLSPVREG